MATSPKPEPAARRKTLVVDSGPEMNQLLSNLFDHREWDVEFVKNNREALDSAGRQAFDLIVTSERTSGQEDVQLLRRLRMVRPHTRLIILADEFVPGDVLTAIRERAFSYFARPFSTERLPPPPTTPHATARPR